MQIVSKGSSRAALAVTVESGDSTSDANHLGCPSTGRTRALDQIMLPLNE